MTGPVKTRIVGHVLEVTLDRPKANAVDLATSRILGEVFRDFRDNPDLRVVCTSIKGKRQPSLCGRPEQTGIQLKIRCTLSLSAALTFPVWGI